MSSSINAGPSLQAPQGLNGIRVELGDAHPQIGGVRGEIGQSNFFLALRATGGAQRNVDLDKKITSVASKIFEETIKLIAQTVGLEAETIKIEINYTTQMATYIDAQGNKQKIDLTEPTLANGNEIKEKMQKFMTTVSSCKAHGSDRLAEYKEMISGPVSGKSLFMQGVNGMGSTLQTFAKKNLQELMNKANPGSGEDIGEIDQRMKAMATVDLYKKNLTEELRDQIHYLESEISAASLNALPAFSVDDMKNDLKILKESYSALERSHNEALYAYIALGGFEPGTNAVHLGKADRIEANLRSYLVKDQKIDHKWGGLRKKEEGLEKGDDLFIKGVGALAVSSQDRPVFNQYRESKKVHADYGTGMEGSFLLMKALTHRLGRIGSERNDHLDRRDELVVGKGLKCSSVKDALFRKMAETETQVATLHHIIDNLPVDGSPSALIKQRLVAIKNA